MEILILEKSKLCSIDEDTINRLLENGVPKKAYDWDGHSCAVGADRYVIAVRGDGLVRVVKNSRLDDYVTLKVIEKMTLKAALDSKKMSQSELAKALSVPRQNISRWVLGEFAPRLETQRAIDSILGVTVEYNK